MGIYVNYRRITPNEFMQLKLNPNLAETFFGWNVNLDDEAALAKYWDSLESDERYLDIDRNWQAIHFLITGEIASTSRNKTTSPLHNVVMGGTETEFEAGYGLVHYLTTDEVIEAAQALNKISLNDLNSRLKPEIFNTADIYPDGHKWDEKGLDRLVNTYQRLVKFFDEAAKQGNIILISFI